jgi:hypothetical protein
MIPFKISVHRTIKKRGITVSVLDEAKYEKLTLFFDDAWFILSWIVSNQNKIC